jgi:hypothetical protein
MKTNSINNSASNAVQKILDAFENGNIPQAISCSVFLPPSNIPAYKWTVRNRALAFMQGTGDARGFNQWKESGRYIKKGSKAVYILGPVLKKTNSIEIVIDETTGEEKENEIKRCVGYFGIPVFRVEDTEGDPIEYLKLDTEKLPLADVAKKWGIDIKAGAFNGEYNGYYCNARNEIVMATNDERTFLHELSHSAHYRIDPNAQYLPSWQKEIVADLSAAALFYMLGKEPPLGNHFGYIKSNAQIAGIDTLKACLKILDTCLAVIDEIVKETKSVEFNQAA